MKVKDGIIGFVIGDALGVPVEFYSREELEKDPIFDMEEYGTHNQPKGTWSDDSSMILATMQSIINKKGIDYDDIMKEFCSWWCDGKYTQNNNAFDIGGTTSRGLQRYLSGTEALKCGGDSTHDNGNGSLMRVIPLAFMGNTDYETIENISSLTHAHKRSRIACVLYIEIAKSMLENDLAISEHIKNSNKKIMDYYAGDEELKHFQRIFDDDFSEGILSSGYVIDSLESVIYCLETTSCYKDAVLKAVNLGGDTDTIAGLCGGLAGIYYGFDSIPIDWTSQVPQIDYVLSLCEKFEALCDESH